VALPAYEAAIEIPAVVISAVAILLFAAAFLFGARLLSRDRGHDASAPDSQAQSTPAQILPFYRIALIAAVFQAGLVLLLPWALGFNQLLAGDAAVLGVVAVFIIVLLCAFVYAARRRALDWEERSPVTDSNG
jgi:NADH:ubiquinone oxidoreductase subunit 3 (subunit A)